MSFSLLSRVSLFSMDAVFSSYSRKTRPSRRAFFSTREAQEQEKQETMPTLVDAEIQIQYRLLITTITISLTVENS